MRLPSSSATVAFASDEGRRPRLRATPRAYRATACGAAGPVTSPRLRPFERRGPPPPLRRAAGGAVRGDAPRDQRHARLAGTAATGAAGCGRGGGAPARTARAERALGGAGAALAEASRRAALGTGGARGALGRGALAPPVGGRARRRDAFAAVHHRATRRSRPLPDRLRGEGGLGGRADGRPPFQPGAAGAAGRGTCDPPRGA